MYNVPWSSTPKWLLLSCRFANTVILLSMLSIISAHLLRISKLNPFNHMVYGPLSNCLRLKTQVTLCPPRLATSEWLVLSRRESHPLYITTLLGRSDRHPSPIHPHLNFPHRQCEIKCRSFINMTLNPDRSFMALDDLFDNG